MSNKSKWEQYVGRKIRINTMVDEPQYTGKEGVIECVDDLGQLHGTWGGLAVQPHRDVFEFLEH